MKILVCNDTRTTPGTDETGNIDYYLKCILEEGGHKARLFDGRRSDGAVMHNPEEMAAALAQEVRTLQRDVIVMDLNWFGNFDAGIEMLRCLRRNTDLLSKVRVILFSRFIANTLQGRLHEELGIAPDDFLDRLRTPLSKLAAKLDYTPSPNSPSATCSTNSRTTSRAKPPPASNRALIMW